MSILLFLQLGMSCKKEPSIAPCENSENPSVKVNKNFDLIWDVKVNEVFSCRATIVTPNEVIYWTWKGAGHNDYMVAFNKSTGDTLWHRDATGGTNNHRLIGNYIYSDIDERLVCIDPSTGNEVWRFSPAYLSDYVYADGSIYAFFDQGNSADSTALYKINPLSGSAMHLYSVYTSDRAGYSQSPRGIAYWKHPNGNEIIFAQSTGVNVSVGRCDYFVIDITGDSMYWDLGNYFNTSARGFTPLLEGNNIYISGGFAGVASLNLVTKSTNWKVSEPTASQTGGKYAVIADGKLFKEVGNFGHFNVLNLLNGNQLKTYSGIGTNFRGSPLRFFNNKVYFTTTDVLGIVETSTGNMIQNLHFSEYVGETAGGPQSGMDVDPSNGYIYTTRGYSFVCIKEK